MEASEKTTFIKKDAIITIKVGAGYLERLQVLLVSLVDGKSAEELSEITEIIKAGKGDNDKDIANIETVASLIKALEQGATAQGLTEERIPTV